MRRHKFSEMHGVARSISLPDLATCSTHGALHMYPTTPDGRYFVVKERLWRCSNPALDEEVRQQQVNELMAARRAVKAAKTSRDSAQLKAARAEVNAAKIGLGERGPVWWNDGAPDLNRRMVRNTPYAGWYEALNTRES
jgi:hypothetical protein